jgi:pyruvate ferredoxin oxidoreductase alpha subunit/phenylglyoxylate dehydrogenase alpha subunit
MDKKIPIISHIGGLAGTDLTTDHMAEAIENAAKAAKGKVPKETIWLT